MNWEALEATAGTWPMYFIVFWFGALWGSFGNVCIYRMPPSDEFPNGRSVATPPSHCFVCTNRVAWYDNVPLLAYLWLRGRCRYCKTEFSARYLIVEALMGVLFAVAWYIFVDLGAGMDVTIQMRLLRFGILAFFTFMLVVIAFIDLDHQLILNKLTYPGIVAFYGLGLLLPERQWQDGLIGAALGYGLVVGVAEGYRLLRGRVGMGYGDAKLIAMGGALLGYEGVLSGFFGGAVVACAILLIVLPIYALAFWLKKRNAKAVADGGTDNPETRASIAAAAALGGSVDSDDTAGEETSLLKIYMPFGPCIAIALLLYAYARPFVQIELRLPW